MRGSVGRAVPVQRQMASQEGRGPGTACRKLPERHRCRRGPKRSTKTWGQHHLAPSTQGEDCFFESGFAMLNLVAGMRGRRQNHRHSRGYPVGLIGGLQPTPCTSFLYFSHGWRQYLEVMGQGCLFYFILAVLQASGSRVAAGHFGFCFL